MYFERVNSRTHVFRYVGDIIIHSIFFTEYIDRNICYTIYIYNTAINIYQGQYIVRCNVLDI